MNIRQVIRDSRSDTAFPLTGCAEKYGILPGRYNAHTDCLRNIITVTRRSSRQQALRGAWTSWLEGGSPSPAGARSHRDEEHLHQVALIAWRDALRGTFPQVGMLFAIPNGGLRQPRTAGRLKAEGAQDGVPDLFLPVPRGRCPGLFIEMKSTRGRLSPRQRWWRDALGEQGYRVELARSWIAGCSLIADHLDLPGELIPPAGASPAHAGQTASLLLGSWSARHNRRG